MQLSSARIAVTVCRPVPINRAMGTGSSEIAKTSKAGANGNRRPPLERLQMLCDPGSLEVIRSAATSVRLRASALPGDGVVAGIGRVTGRPMACYAQDASFLGGSLGVAQAEMIERLLQLAKRSLVPVVSLVESGGARMQEGAAALCGYARIFRQNVLLSGLVPQVSIMTGVAAGGGSYSPAPDRLPRDDGGRRDVPHRLAGGAGGNGGGHRGIRAGRPPGARAKRRLRPRRPERPLGGRPGEVAARLPAAAGPWRSGLELCAAACASRPRRAGAAIPRRVYASAASATASSTTVRCSSSPRAGRGR
jgi:hypothetical protein